MKFLVATVENVKEVQNYYDELDCESLKAIKLKKFDLLNLIQLIESGRVIFYLLYNEKDLVSVVKAKLGEGERAHSSCLFISTKENFRNQGYAKSLIRYATDELRKNKIKIVRLKVLSWNKPAIATVEKAGFTLSGRIVMSNYDEDINEYIDDLLYHMFL